MAKKVAEAIGVPVPSKPVKPVNEGKPADANEQHYAPIVKDPETLSDDALSIIKNLKNASQTRKVAFISLGGHDGKQAKDLENRLEKAGAKLKVVSAQLGTIKDNNGVEGEIAETLFNTSSVLYDAVVIADGGKESTEILANAQVKEFVMDAFNHCKPILVLPKTDTFIEELGLPCCKKEKKSASELYIDSTVDGFLKSLSKHRLWDREKLL
ncbi:MAG: DJ-1/PfpI family protein [Cyclobacteriaceae bacterium]